MAQTTYNLNGHACAVHVTHVAYWYCTCTRMCILNGTRVYMRTQSLHMQSVHSLAWPDRLFSFYIRAGKIRVW